MSLETLQSFLLWSGLINYGVLTVSFVFYACARTAIFRLHSRWFTLERERFDAIVYLVFALYKVGIWCLFLVPWLALCVIRGAA